MRLNSQENYLDAWYPISDDFYIVSERKFIFCKFNIFYNFIISKF